MSNLPHRTKVTMIPVTSSNIRAIGFDRTDKKRGNLYVQYHSNDCAVRAKNPCDCAGGATWKHEGLTHEEMADLGQAPSVGKHFNAHIKPKYLGVKV